MNTVAIEVIRDGHRVLLDVPEHLLAPSLDGHDVIGYDSEDEPVTLTEEEVDEFLSDRRIDAMAAREEAMRNFSGPI